MAQRRIRFTLALLAGGVMSASAQQAPVPPAPLRPPAQPGAPPPGLAAPAAPAPQQPKKAAPKPAPEPAPGQTQENSKIAQPIANFSGLDKISGRIITFDVAINETVQFGALQVTPRVCYSRPPTVAPLTTAFIEVDEVTLDAKIRRIFTGWVFADSPGLHAVEHAVYDVWLTDCKATAPAPAPAVAAGAPAPASKPQ